MAALVTGSATSDEEVPGELFRRYERLSQGRSVPRPAGMPGHLGNRLSCGVGLLNLVVWANREARPQRVQERTRRRCTGGWPPTLSVWIASTGSPVPRITNQ